MAASLQPENNQQSMVGSSEPSPSSPTNPQDSQSQQIPQTPTQQDQLTEETEKTARYVKLLEESMKAQNAQIQQLVSERQQFQQQSTQPPQATPVQSDPTTFFNNPQGVLAEFETRIKKHLDDTVKPLQEFVRGIRGEGTPYGNLKNQFQNDSRYSRQLSDPKIAYAVDEIMKNQAPSPELMRSAIIQAVGMNATGELDIALVQAGVDPSRFNTPAQPQSQPTTPQMRVVPPYIPPSPPPTPTQQQPTAQVEPLNELQKRLAREKGMTEDAYRAWLTMPANEVATSKLGRPNNG